jgi:hypothetical protein
MKEDQKTGVQEKQHDLPEKSQPGRSRKGMAVCPGNAGG